MMGSNESSGEEIPRALKAPYIKLSISQSVSCTETSGYTIVTWDNPPSTVDRPLQWAAFNNDMEIEQLIGIALDDIELYTEDLAKKRKKLAKKRKKRA